MSGRADSLVGTRLPGSVCARCAHAGGLLGWLEAALPPLPFAMCFSAAEERPGGILALPNGFLKTLVAKRYGDQLLGYAESVGFERVEIVVDPTVSAPSAADEQPPARQHEERPAAVREQPPGLTPRRLARPGDRARPARLRRRLLSVEHTEVQAVQFLPAVLLPQLILCGLLVPRDGMAPA